jgi:hypothetical protein
MTKLERLMEEQWRKAHGTPLTVNRTNGPCVSVTLAAQDASRKAAQAARAVKDSADSLVLARFMQRAAVEKRARTEALVSHSIRGLENSTKRLDCITNDRLAVTARYNATENRVQMLG